MTTTAHRCPRCGGAVHTLPTCHTFMQGGRWAACMPCDSATDWFCGEDECDWSYVEGLNPRNPRAAENAAARPDWLPA